MGVDTSMLVNVEPNQAKQVAASCTTEQPWNVPGLTGNRPIPTSDSKIGLPVSLRTAVIVGPNTEPNVLS